jgi:hypothetical protein
VALGLLMPLVNLTPLNSILGTKHNSLRNIIIYSSITALWLMAYK